MKRRFIQPQRATVIVLLIVAVRLLMACSGPSHAELSAEDCAKLLESSTQHALYAKLPIPEQLPPAIAEIYSIPQDSVELSREPSQNSGDELTVIRWETQDRRYGLDFTSTRLVSFAIGYQQGKPIVGDILTCMGRPDAYFAWNALGPADAGMWLTLVLFYPERGAIVLVNYPTPFGVQSSSAGQLAFEDVIHRTIDGIRSTNPTSMDELLINYIQDDFRLDVQQGSGKQVLAWYKQVIKPWPNDERKLEYSILPYPEIPLLPHIAQTP